jgi:DNA uptake protein ComE-like DNA-binding protein
MMHQLRAFFSVRLSGVLLAAALVGGAPAEAQARDYEAQVRVESLEDLYELQHNGDLEDATVEVLAALLERPMNVNRADRYLLYDLPQVTFELADAILAYRAEKGAFTALDELAQVPGMTPATLTAIAPFVTVGTVEDVPVEATKDIHGTAEVGTIARRGFDKPAVDIDPIVERQTTLPQSYLRLTGTGFTYLGAGALATLRRRTDAFWDYSRGTLVSKGPKDMLDLDDVYAVGGYGPYSIILGSYKVGFGERLVFSSSQRRFPNGWSENDTLFENKETGKLGPGSGQFGTAVSAKGMALGTTWLDATAFASDTWNDLYQYDLGYGFDEYYGANHCQTAADCPNGYTCGDDKRCHSSRIANGEDPRAADYRYETLKDAYEERLGGANVTLNLNERTRIGTTAYVAHTELRVATEADANFGYSAGLPRKRGFGSYGLNGSFGLGFAEVAGEVARTLSGGNAVYLRTVLEPVPWSETQVSLRYYDPYFDNPHSKAEAQPDMLFGNRSRNEQGVAVDETLRPIAGLALVTHIDLWQNRYAAHYSDAGELSYLKRGPLASTNVWLSQRVDYDVTSADGASLLVEYKNKDLRHNGRKEFYDSLSLCDPGDSNGAAECGAGERRKLQLKLSTTRIPKASVWASYTGAWVDVSKYKTRFDFEQRLRLHAGVNAWTGGRVVAHVSYYIHKVDVSALSAAAAARYSGDPRDDPRLESYAEVRQKVGRDYTLWVRYGLINYKGDQAGRYQWYQLAKMDFEARF